MLKLIYHLGKPFDKLTASRLDGGKFFDYHGGNRCSLKARGRESRT